MAEQEQLDRRSGEDRRSPPPQPSAWQDPRFLFQIFAFVIIQLVAGISSHFVLSSRVDQIDTKTAGASDKLAAAAAQMNSAAIELKADMKELRGDLKVQAGENARLRSDVDAMTRELADQRTKSNELAAYVANWRERLIKLEAQRR